MAYSEYYCQTTGNNLNAGSTTGDNAVYTGVGDSDGTSKFTPSDGSTPASSVNVGDFASVYVTAGATVAVFVGRVTVVAAGVNGAITVSTTAKSGTFPASSGSAHTITCKTGGAWKGPNAAVGFPFGFVTAALTDAAGDIPRVNFKSGTNYAITAAISHSIAGPVQFQGYSASPGDGVRAVIDGGTSGAAYALLTVSGAKNSIADMIFQNNGASSHDCGLALTGPGCEALRCIANNLRGNGFQLASGPAIAVECEAYACCQNNSAGDAGFSLGTANVAVRCYSHNNVGSNAVGFAATNNATFLACISDTNGGNGFQLDASSMTLMFQCDSYNNTGDGVRLVNGGSACYRIENCNLVKNGGYGINGTGAGARLGDVVNCGFGSGTQANTSGTTNGLSGMLTGGSVTYGSGLSPWTAPSTGNFSINLSAAENAGRGTFTETGSSKTGTVGSPDIGAAPHSSSGGCGGIFNSGILQGIGCV